MAAHRLGRFEIDGKVVIGRLEGDRVAVVCEGDELPRALENGGVLGSKRDCAVQKARLLPPIDPSARVFAVAVNYRAHGKEAGAKPPPRPLIFYKAPSNFVAHDEVLDAHRDMTAQFDYEGEIAVVIGKRCHRASPEKALDYVAGACAFNDGSARDLGKVPAGDSYWPDWMAAKCLDRASALGPAITCGAEIVDKLRTRALGLTTRLNGELVQEGSMEEMIFSTEQIIAALSSYMTLLPGDVIATGTPAGVGMGRNRFLKSGDALEFGVSSLDTLRVTVG